MSTSEANHVISEVVKLLSDKFEPRFKQIDQRFDQIDQRFDKIDQRFEGIEHTLDTIKTDVKDLKQRTVYLEDTMSDVLVEQRLIRHTMVNNLDDIMHLKGRLASHGS